MPPTGVADTRVIDLNANFVGLGRGDLDILNRQILGSLPCDSGLLGSGLACPTFGLDLLCLFLLSSFFLFFFCPFFLLFSLVLSFSSLCSATLR